MIQDSFGLTQLNSKRLEFSCFQEKDASEAYVAITPNLARYMAWDVPESDEQFREVQMSWLQKMQSQDKLVFVIRDYNTREFIGLCGLHRLKSEAPTVGIWVKEQQHGHKFGREAVETLIKFAFEKLGLRQLYYPVAEENWASRKIAETLGGKIIKHLAQRKYMAVIYEISQYAD